VREPVEASSFTITLSIEPASPVTIPLSPSNSECELSAEAVTLDSSNWDSGISVAVRARDDELADGEQTCLVLSGPASSATPAYNGLIADDVVVTVTDDEGAAIVVYPTELSLSEPEAFEAFTVSLASQPTGAVTITLTPSNNECGVSTDTVVLDSSTWQIGARVIVGAVDDSLDDGEQPCLVRTSPAASTGADYNGIDAEDVSVTVQDDDTSGIVIGPTSIDVSEPDGSADFVISLTSEPAAVVSLPVTVSSDECAISLDTVIFDSANWSTGVTVTVRAVDDGIDDGQQACDVQTGVTASEGSDYSGMEVADVSVSVYDDDAAGIVVAPTNISLSEPDGTGAFTLTLGSLPSASVTIPMSVEGEECAISSDTAVLDATNWNSGAVVSVTVVDDHLDDGDQICTVSTDPAASDGSDYAGMESPDVSVTVMDDDVAGIVVDPTSMVVAEPGGSGSFTIALSSEPAAAVTIGLSRSSEECALSHTSVTLDATNWRSGAAVLVTAVDDNLADGEQGCIVETGAASSSGADYSSMPSEDVSVAVQDDDTAGVLVSPTTVSISEPQGSAPISITLSSEPAAVVTIPLSTSSTECSVSPNTVTLDSTNWRSGARVVVTAVDDSLDDGDRPCTVQTGPATSNGTDYAGMPSDAVAVTVLDEDTAGIVVAPVAVTLPEPDGSAVITVSLGSQPSAGVTIPLAPSNDECSVSAEAITLDGSNWKEGVQVRINVVDDTVNDGEQVCTVQTGAASSTGADYNDVLPNDVIVTVLDDDAAGIVVAPTSLQLGETGGSAAYAVVLNSAPTARVVVTISSDGQTAVSPARLIFTNLNWNVQQPVTVSATDDKIAEGLHRSVITHAASSDDQNYSGLTLATVTANITDDDTTALVAEPSEPMVAEGGEPTSYLLSLSAQPTRTVTIDIGTDGQTTVTPTLVVFTELQWNVPQTVTVAAVDDADAEGQHSSAISHTISSGFAEDLSVEAMIVTAEVTDNEPLAVIETLKETLTGLIPSRSEEMTSTGQPGEATGGEESGGLKIPPTYILVGAVALLVIFALVVEFVFRR
jgi:hypothetical protein